MTNPAGSFRPEDQLTRLNILLPKIVAPIIAAIVAGLIAYQQSKNLITSLIAALSTLLPLYGYSLSSLAVASRTNPAGLTSMNAVTSSVPGKPNVTSDPVDGVKP